MAPKVLCVDDDPGALFCFEESLATMQGFEAVTATTLQEGLAKLQGIDIAMIDYRLPDGTGTVLLLACADLGIPAALCTAFFDEAVLDKCIQAGMFDVLAKPMSKEEIQRMVLRLMDKVAKRNS